MHIEYVSRIGTRLTMCCSSTARNGSRSGAVVTSVGVRDSLVAPGATRGRRRVSTVSWSLELASRGSWLLPHRRAADALEATVAGDSGACDMIPLPDAAPRLFGGELDRHVQARAGEVDITYFMVKCYKPESEAWIDHWYIKGLGHRCVQHLHIELVHTSHIDVTTAAVRRSPAQATATQAAVVGCIHLYPRRDRRPYDDRG